MNSEIENVRRVKKAQQFQKELRVYFELFEAAFDELHSAVIEKITASENRIGPRQDYPTMVHLDNGFPSFGKAGVYSDGSPRDYVGVFRNNSIIGALLGGYTRPGAGFPKGEELESFLRTHEIGNRLKLGALGFDWPIDRLVGNAVERYFHKHGLEAPIDQKRRSAIIQPLIKGTVLSELNVRLVVPITMTAFNVDHFPLTETTYITRMSNAVQLARARMSTLGSGAVEMVVGAATHAFVANDWKVTVDSVDDISASLGQASSNVLEEIESFFGALRIATGESTGYAQIVWIPKGWAGGYYCDLPYVYGTTLRRYPSEYDNYGWVQHKTPLDVEQLSNVRQTFRALLDNNSEAVRLAVKRLNGCFNRTDAADAILDGTIGLEILLGDDQNQSLSYKLRLRTGALAQLHPRHDWAANEVFSKVKRLYEARSAIIHGSKKKRSKNTSDPIDGSYKVERSLASDLLSYVLEILLQNPKYIDPIKIDKELLLGDKSRSPQ